MKRLYELVRSGRCSGTGTAADGPRPTRSNRCAARGLGMAAGGRHGVARRCSGARSARRSRFAATCSTSGIRAQKRRLVSSEETSPGRARRAAFGHGRRRVRLTELAEPHFVVLLPTRTSPLRSSRTMPANGGQRLRAPSASISSTAISHRRSRAASQRAVVLDLPCLCSGTPAVSTTESFGPSMSGRVDRVTRRACVGDDRALLAEQRIEQRRFPDVRLTDQAMPARLPATASVAGSGRRSRRATRRPFAMDRETENGMPKPSRANSPPPQPQLWPFGFVRDSSAPGASAPQIAATSS